MISPIGHKIKNKQTKAQGFTLIEMILVMAILSSVLVITAPKMSRFFFGQTLTNEAHRLIAVLRYAQTESISSGIPLQVWFEEEQGLFGIEPQPGYQSEDQEEFFYQLDTNFTMEILPDQAIQQGIARIMFWPDGRIEENNLVCIQVAQNDDIISIAKPWHEEIYQIIKEEDVTQLLLNQIP